MDSKAPGLYPSVNSPDDSPSYETFNIQNPSRPPSGASSSGSHPRLESPKNSGMPILGQGQVLMFCPYCECQVVTDTSSKPSASAWILGLLLCGLGFWLCACLPCLVASFKRVTHKCPKCDNFLGSYRGDL